VVITPTAVTLATNELILSASNASLAQSYALYLDGQDGGEYPFSDTAGDLMLNATTTLNLAIGGTDEVAISSTTVTLGSNDLTLTAGELNLSAGNAALAQAFALYLDGQDGGEYIFSDVANELMLNATTTLNLAIGGTDEVSITSSVVTIGSNNLTLSAGELTLTAGNASVAQNYALYLDGQDGGEYLFSDVVGYAMLNGTTGVNIAIGGTDKIQVTSGATTFTNDITMTAGEFISGAPIKQLITTKSSDVYLTAAESGVIKASDDIYLSLPASSGNTGLTYTIKATASFSGGVYVYTDGGDTLDGVNNLVSTAQYDAMSVICDGSVWHVLNQLGTWN